MLGAGTNNMYFHALPPLPSVFLLGNQGIAYLLYPLLGWLADVYFTWYKFAFVLTILWCSVFALIILVILLTHGKYFELYAVGEYFWWPISLHWACLKPLLFSLAWIKCWRTLQTSWAQWYYWGSKLGQLLLAMLTTGFLLYFSHCEIFSFLWLQVFFLWLLEQQRCYCQPCKIKVQLS